VCSFLDGISIASLQLAGKSFYGTISHYQHSEPPRSACFKYALRCLLEKDEPEHAKSFLPCVLCKCLRPRADFHASCLLSMDEEWPIMLRRPSTERFCQRHFNGLRAKKSFAPGYDRWVQYWRQVCMHCGVWDGRCSCSCECLKVKHEVLIHYRKENDPRMRVRFVRQSDGELVAEEYSDARKSKLLDH